MEMSELVLANRLARLPTLESGERIVREAIEFQLFLGNDGGR